MHVIFLVIPEFITLICNTYAFHLSIVTPTAYGGGIVEWLTRRTNNLRIANRMASNLVRDKQEQETL